MKEIIRKTSPKLYRIIIKIYLLFKKISRSILWSKLDELYWKRRSDKNWIEKWYWESTNHPHRKFLINHIISTNSNSIIEIWSNCWPNLNLLNKERNWLNLVWIDINQEAVKFWNKQFKELNIENIKLYQWYADKLQKFDSNEFDLLFTDAIMIYIWKDKIKQTIKEFIRITKKHIILIEQHLEEDDWNWIYNNLRLRNYKKLFENFEEVTKIDLIKLDKKIWSWDRIKYGYLIKIELK